MSYYGISYPEHAEKDFKEMVQHNCNAVILALSEFDIDFWFPNIVRVAKVAKELGLKVYLDTWGIGKWFGGEPPSVFLTNNPVNRQVSAVTNELLPAVCFNTKAFRDYFYGLCEKLAHEVEADGFFWDEPHCLKAMLRLLVEQVMTGPVVVRFARGSLNSCMGMKCPGY